MPTITIKVAKGYEGNLEVIPCDRSKCEINEHFVCGKCHISFHNFKSLDIHVDKCDFRPVYYSADTSKGDIKAETHNP